MMRRCYLMLKRTFINWSYGAFLNDESETWANRLRVVLEYSVLVLMFPVYFMLRQGTQLSRAPLGAGESQLEQKDAGVINLGSYILVNSISFFLAQIYKLLSKHSQSSLSALSQHPFSTLSGLSQLSMSSHELVYIVSVTNIYSQRVNHTLFPIHYCKNGLSGSADPLNPGW